MTAPTIRLSGNSRLQFNGVGKANKSYFIDSHAQLICSLDGKFGEFPEEEKCLEACYHLDSSSGVYERWISELE